MVGVYSDPFAPLVGGVYQVHKWGVEVIEYPDMREAAIGLTVSIGPVRPVYSYHACVMILMKRDGMTWEDACEWLDFNTCNTYVGDETPIVVQITDIEWDEYSE